MKYVLLILLFVLPGFDVFGEDPMTTLEQRIVNLEHKNAELYHDLAQKKSLGLGSLATENISISGLLELEAQAASGKFQGAGSDSSSDLSLATAQLGFDVELNDQISAQLSLLFEDGEDFTLDEGSILLSNGLWSGRFGLQYLPFGNFYSHFISDPLTLVLGEIQETAIRGDYQHDLFTLSAFVFNGEAEKAGDSEDHIRDWGLSLSIAPRENIELGASYLSDLADTAAELPLAAANSYRKRVGGWSLYTLVGFGVFELSAEILGATESFATLDLDADGDGSGDKPLAWNVELAWGLTEQVEVAARYEGSSEFADQPETGYGLSTSWGFWDNLSLSFEYLHGEFDRRFAPTDLSGAQQTDRDLFTTQLAMAF